MLYEVDFSIKSEAEINSMIHTALVFAQSVTECRVVANEMTLEYPLADYGPLDIYISEGEQ